jgi:hypothetical protein
MDFPVAAFDGGEVFGQDTLKQPSRYRRKESDTKFIASIAELKPQNLDRDPAEDF